MQTIWLFARVLLTTFVQECGDTGLQCPVCCDVVCSIYGLWFHVTKRHPNQSTAQCTLRCPVCQTVFKGLQKLDSHIHACHLTADPTHDQFSSDDDENMASDVPKKSVTASKSFSLLSVCSQEMLQQLDFSCNKFALIAQISAEHQPFRRVTKASVSCRSCDRSFSCAAALDLHVKNLHDEAVDALSCTACSLCFVSRAQRDEHMMLAHDAPQVVLEFLRSSQDSDPRAGKVTREEFLLVLGLKALPVVDDASEDVVPPKPVNKVTDVDANQNLVRTADLPAAASGALSLATPLVVGPLMALTAPVTPMFSSIVRVPSVLPHSLSLVSSQAIAPPPFRFSSTADTMTLLNAGASSIQSITGMAGTFPFLSPFVPTASLEGQSPGMVPSIVQNCSRDANMSTPTETVSGDGDGGTKAGDGSDSEESNRMSMYY